ncbi:MAG: glycosyltransferase family 2 protein [Fibrobacter sp.]|nr:glycosyltransferase family 2 protein [Fibrobacter sp.]
MKKITVLIPCYNEEASLHALYDALKKLMDSNASYKWEVLMVNDGSKDHTIDMIKELRKADNRICYVNLSRNFGKENAMLAGFDNATGDCVVIMDADLQHPPHVIPDMIQKWEEGYQDIYGERLSRGKESWFRKQFSLLFYKLLQKTARYDILPNVGDFRLLDRKCIDVLKNLRETERYTKGMFAWIGFKKTSVNFETQDRVAGVSHMSYRSLINLAVEGIMSFTVAPLKWSIYLGLLVSFAAFAFMIYILINTTLYGDPVAGYPTLITVILFLGGVQLLSLGIIGEYLGKIFNESKGRPVYVASEVEI